MNPTIKLILISLIIAALPACATGATPSPSKPFGIDYARFQMRELHESLIRETKQHQARK